MPLCPAVTCCPASWSPRPRWPAEHSGQEHQVSVSVQVAEQPLHHRWGHSWALGALGSCRHPGRRRAGDLAGAPRRPEGREAPPPSPQFSPSLFVHGRGDAYLWPAGSGSSPLQSQAGISVPSVSSPPARRAPFPLKVTASWTGAETLMPSPRAEQSQPGRLRGKPTKAKPSSLTGAGRCSCHDGG